MKILIPKGLICSRGRAGLLEKTLNDESFGNTKSYFEPSMNEDPTRDGNAERVLCPLDSSVGIGLDSGEL